MKKWIRLSQLLLILSLSVNLSLAQTTKILWWFDTFDSAFGQSALDDIDGDGKYEIVFGCYRNDSSIYALNSEDGSLLWKFNASGSGEGCNDVASLLYDLNGNGRKEVIVPSSCNPKTFCFDGQTGQIIWQAPTRGSDSPPVIADLDGDGQMEILHGEFGGYVICLDALTGAVKWEILVDANSWVQTAPTVVDLNGNDTLDFVVATWGFGNNSALYAYNGITKQLLWSLPMNDVVYHGTAIADLDGDGFPELIIGDYDGTLHVVWGKDGTVLWTRQEDYYIGGPVTVGDLNGDGFCEMIFVSWFKVIALDRLGNLFWQYNIPNYGSCFRGVALADIDNDSLPEVLFGSSNGSVYALNGQNGTLIWSLDLKAHYGSDLEFDHAPVIADFTGNDTLDLFIHGGKTDYPNFQTNYGRGYAIQIGKGKGPEWKMFQRDYHRTGSACFEEEEEPVDTTSIRSVASAFADFQIQPNPVGNFERLVIQAPENQPWQVTVFDLSGKMLHSDRQPAFLRFSDFTARGGLFILKFTHPQGSVYKKVVVTE